MEWNCRVSSSSRRGGYSSFCSLQKVSASPYQRWPLTGGYECRVLGWKSPRSSLVCAYGKVTATGGSAVGQSTNNKWKNNKAITANHSGPA